MTEVSSKVGEVGGKHEGETSHSFDPDCRVEKRDISAEKQVKSYDPDAKIAKGERQERKDLSQEQKERIKEETGWSDVIVDSIGSEDECKVYRDAGLVEKEVDDRKCLVSPNIDMEQKDAFGRTNKERMEQGLAPLDKNGNPMELHHIGQHNDSPLAELTQDQHRGKDNYSVLHDTKKESEIDRASFNDERANHWKARAEDE